MCFILGYCYIMITARKGTVDGDIKESYQEVCNTLGLLQDDREWDQVLTEEGVIKKCHLHLEKYSS